MRSTSRTVVSNSASPSEQPVVDLGLQQLAQRVVGDAIEQLAGKGTDHHVARVAFGDSARAHVVDGVLVHAADGRSVGALDVVGVDLQLGLGASQRGRREQQIWIGLLGVGLLRVLANDDAAAEDAAPLVVEDPLTDFKISGSELRFTVSIEADKNRQPSVERFSYALSDDDSQLVAGVFPEVGEGLGDFAQVDEPM